MKTKTHWKSTKKLWNKIRYLTTWITNNSEDYDEKYTKIKFNSDDDVPLNKRVKFYNMVIAVGIVFHESNKYYSEVFLDECLYKL